MSAILPGTTRINAKMITDTPNTVTASNSVRLTRYVPMTFLLLLDVASPADVLNAFMGGYTPARPLDYTLLMDIAQADRYIARLEALAEHRTVPFLPGRAMRWRMFGEGEPLVLVHGGHGSWLHWVRNIEAL